MTDYQQQKIDSIKAKLINNEQLMEVEAPEVVAKNFWSDYWTAFLVTGGIASFFTAFLVIGSIISQYKTLSFPKLENHIHDYYLLLIIKLILVGMPLFILLLAVFIFFKIQRFASAFMHQIEVLPSLDTIKYSHKFHPRKYFKILVRKNFTKGKLILFAYNDITRKN